MKTDKATVTIPYDEFVKHQEQVKEIEWAREIKTKMDKGELIEFKVIAEKLILFGEYSAIDSTPVRTRPSFSFFAQSKGFLPTLQSIPGSDKKMYTVDKI